MAIPKTKCAHLSAFGLQQCFDIPPVDVRNPYYASTVQQSPKVSLSSYIQLSHKDVRRCALAFVVTSQHFENEMNGREQANDKHMKNDF